MLELFYTDTCPYCRKVMNYLESEEIEFIAKDVNEKINYDKLISLGGRAQVPFLFDTENNIKMYESDLIISYVENLNK